MGLTTRKLLLSGLPLIAALAVAGVVIYNRRLPVPSTQPPAGLGQLDPQLRELIVEQATKVAVRPRDSARHAELGLVYSANELWAEAARTYSNAIILGSKDPLVWQYQGAAHFHLGNLEMAERHLRQAVALPSSRASCSWHLGQLLLQSGRADEAVAAFREVVRLEPQEWRGLVGLGQAQLQLGKSQEAVTSLEQAVRVAPQAKAAHSVLARALVAMGKHDRAAHESALGSGSETTPPSDAWTEKLRFSQKTVSAQMELADELESTGHAQAAAILLAEAARFHPRDPAVMNRLAIALNRAENPAEAEFYARRALEIDPAYMPALVTLSFSLVAQQRVAEGLAMAVQAVQKSPKLIQPWLAQANAHLAAGRDSEAATALRAALALEPGNAQVLVELGDVTWRNLGDRAAAELLFIQAHTSEPTGVRPLERLVELSFENTQRLAAQTWLSRLQVIEGNSPFVIEWQQRLGKPQLRE